MSIKDSTKQLFADEIKKMLQETTMDKIRVGELCKRCGANRRTFYYHFLDKYDLIAWIFTRDYFAALDAEEGNYTLQYAINILSKMYEDRSFYKSAYSDESQNSLQKYLYRYFYNLGIESMKHHFDLETLTDEMIYAAKVHSYATIDITLEWLRGEVNYTPEEFARLQYAFMPTELKAAYGIEL